MSMHLLPPMYSTTGKKKGPKKWASAEAKRREQLHKETWARTLKELDKLKPQFSREVQALKPALEKSLAMMSSGPRVPPGRETLIKNILVLQYLESLYNIKVVYSQFLAKRPLLNRQK